MWYHILIFSAVLHLLSLFFLLFNSFECQQFLAVNCYSDVHKYLLQL